MAGRKLNVAILPSRVEILHASFRIKNVCKAVNKSLATIAYGLYKETKRFEVVVIHFETTVPVVSKLKIYAVLFELESLAKNLGFIGQGHGSEIRRRVPIKVRLDVATNTTASKDGNCRRGINMDFSHVCAPNKVLCKAPSFPAKDVRIEGQNGVSARNVFETIKKAVKALFAFIMTIEPVKASTNL